MRQLAPVIIALGVSHFGLAAESEPPRTTVNQITGGVGITAGNAQNNPRFVTTYVDKSVWIFGDKFFEKSPQAIYCWVEEPNMPKCERVFADMFPSRGKDE